MTFRFQLGIAALLIALLPHQTYAQTSTLTGSATTVVDNSFTALELAAPDIDEIALIVVPLTISTATYTLNPNGSATITNSADARFITLDAAGRTAGNIDISGAAPNTPLNVSFSTLTNLTCALCLPGNPDILLGSYTSDVGFNPSTDGSGNLTVNFGFTLTTQAGVAYEDGTYQGTYEVTVSY